MEKTRNQKLMEMQEELNLHAKRLGILKEAAENLEKAETLGELKEISEEALEKVDEVTEVHHLSAESVEIVPESSMDGVGDDIAKILAEAVPVEIPGPNRKERRRQKAKSKRSGRGFTKSIKKFRNRKKR